MKNGYVRVLNDSRIQDDRIMFIQYTSGSTGNPKGVMVTSHALDANLMAGSAAVRANKDTVAVCWVPQYHDYGLICNYLQTCHNNCHSVAMSPLSFIQNPVLWEETIQKFKAKVKKKHYEKNISIGTVKFTYLLTSATAGLNFSYALMAKEE